MVVICVNLSEGKPLFWVRKINNAAAQVNDGYAHPDASVEGRKRRSAENSRVTAENRPLPPGLNVMRTIED